MSDLPVDIDSSYPDRSAGDAAHQQHHDFLHALWNELKGSESAAGVATLRALLDGEYQPIDADLTAIAALVTTAYGRGLLTDADAAAFKARLQGLLDGTYAPPPWLASIFPQKPNSSVGTWVTVFQGSAAIFGMDLEQSTPALNNSFTFKVALSAGTWALEVMYMKYTDSGRFNVSLDGVSVGGSVDTYNASLTFNHKVDFTGITVASPGVVPLTVTATGKNVSSSGYQVRIQNLALRRTA